MNFSTLTLARYGVRKVREEMNRTVSLGVVGSSTSFRRRLITFLFPDVIRFEDAWILPDVIPEVFSIRELDWSDTEGAKDCDALIGVFHPLQDTEIIEEISNMLSMDMTFVAIVDTSSLSIKDLLGSLGLGHFRLLRWLDRFHVLGTDDVSVEVREARRHRLLQKLVDFLEDRQRGLSFVAHAGDSFLKERYTLDRIHRTSMAAAALFLFELYSFPTVKALVNMGRELEATGDVTPPTMVELVDGLVHTIAYIHTRRKATDTMLEPVRKVVRWGLTPIYLMSGLSGGAMGALVYMLMYALGRSLDYMIARAQEHTATSSR